MSSKYLSQVVICPCLFCFLWHRCFIFYVVAFHNHFFYEFCILSHSSKCLPWSKFFKIFLCIVLKVSFNSLTSLITWNLSLVWGSSSIIFIFHRYVSSFPQSIYSIVHNISIGFPEANLTISKFSYLFGYISRLSFLLP